ncbi:MAG: hypothetical protein V4692_03690 [Bdellovibrionota bacterium]
MNTVNGTAVSKAERKEDVAVEKDLELKAHIYQQLVELQPYLSPESQIAVLVQQEADEDDNEEHVLTLVATLGDYHLETEGRNINVYEAFGIAKRKMVQQLDEWYASVVDATNRDEIIQSVIEHRHLVH